MLFQFVRIVKDFSANFTWWGVQKMSSFDMIIKMTLQRVFVITLWARKFCWPFGVLFQLVLIERVFIRLVVFQIFCLTCRRAKRILSLLQPREKGFSKVLLLPTMFGKLSFTRNLAFYGVFGPKIPIFRNFQNLFLDFTVIFPYDSGSAKTMPLSIWLYLVRVKS